MISYGETAFKVVVVGILKESQYVYIGSPNQGIPEINNLFLKTSHNEKFILMPNVFDGDIVSYYVNSGFIVEYNNKEQFFDKTYSKVINEGIGKFSTFDELNNNFYSNLFSNYDTYIFLFIITYIFIIASIGGYNLLETLSYKRILTIYYITGINWNKGILLITLKNLIMIMVPTIIFSIVFNISLSKNTGYVFNNNVILITVLLYFIVFAITTIGTIVTLKNAKLVEILKEVE